MTLDPRRRFNDSEKAHLYTLADGKCQGCGRDLEPGWHADHRRPHSAGGATDITNAAALCPACNIAKSDTVEGAGPKLRPWQRRAMGVYMASTPADFLAVATPGAGKTTLALSIARQLLDDGMVARVMVVVPSRHLRHQWHKAAHKLGINLDPNIDKKFGITSDFHGAAVTYQGVAAEARSYRYLSSQRDTLVILDEVHHCGDSLDWGDKIQHAFGAAKFRLCLSGTPFRSDNATIPFVRYTDGKSEADYRYDYSAALQDGVCRPVIFPHYDSDIEWMSGMSVCKSRFTEDLTDERRRERLRAALRSGDFLPGMLREANDKLQEVRDEGDFKAGGLVIAMRQDDAGDIARTLTEISGEEAIVAISDDPAAHEKIKAFGNGRQRWLVAVNMVSEGVDIPRLRVGVYATNIVTELFFRQSVGRLVRVNRDLDDQVAYMFLPRDEAILQHARTIKEERSHAIIEALAIERGEITERSGESVQPSLFAALGSSAPEQSGSIYDQSDYEAAELAGVRADCAALGIMVAPEKIIQLLRLRGANASPVAQPEQSVQPQGKTHAERKKDICNRNQSLAIHIGRITNVHVKDVHQAANAATKCPTPKAATVEQLERKQQWLLKELEAVGRGA